MSPQLPTRLSIIMPDKVDLLLEHFGGHRLADRANSLGFIAVATTATGVEALARLDEVKSIFEDQRIHSLT